MTGPNQIFQTESVQEEIQTNRRIRQTAWFAVVLLVIILLGAGSSYLRSGKGAITQLERQNEAANLYEQVNPKQGYNLSFSYGELGPQLIESGLINYEAFAAIYQSSAIPLPRKKLKS